MRDIAPPIGKQNLPLKTLEMPILPLPAQLPAQALPDVYPEEDKGRK